MRDEPEEIESAIHRKLDAFISRACDSDDQDDPLALAAAAMRITAHGQVTRDTLVLAARNQGFTWSTIASELNLSVSTCCEAAQRAAIWLKSAETVADAPAPPGTGKWTWEHWHRTICALIFGKPNETEDM